LAAQLSLPIPAPIALGAPAGGYPWPWSVYGWLDGESACAEGIADMAAFARSLAAFLAELQRADTTGAPGPGPHNFFWSGWQSATVTRVRPSKRLPATSIPRLRWPSGRRRWALWKALITLAKRDGGAREADASRQTLSRVLDDDQQCRL